MSNPPPDSELKVLRFLKNSYKVTKRTLQKDLKWHRLIEEDEGVIGHAWFASRREDPNHKLANILRLITILIFSHLYYFYFQSHISVHLDGSFIRWAWTFEKIELSDAILYNTPGVSDQLERKERFDPGQFKPRWLIQITFNKYGRPGEHDVRLVKCRDENEAVESKRYTALSYAYDDARDLFKEWYPNVRDGDIPLRDRYYPSDRNGNPHVLELMKRDPMMTAWNQVSSDPKKQETWNKTALRQRNARAFLDCYIDIRYEQWLKEGGEDNVEYVWLDEFCLYDPEEPSLETRNEELGRMADIFRFAEAVCVYCPIPGCHHVTKRPNKDCQQCITTGRRCKRCSPHQCRWGSRLWTLSEIVHANKVISMKRVQEQRGEPFHSVWVYSLTEMDGKNFRAQIQRQAELDGQWHLHSIMRHANNAGSSTWQHAIHSLVVEAILRNQASDYGNQHIAKALNGLLPRRAVPKHLLGKDGWADLAWLLELNQGFYNAAGLAAVCGMGETTTQGKGWLGPPLAPAPGNERLEPVVIAFPVPSGLFIANPRIVGLKTDIKRDIGGMYRTKKLFIFQIVTLLVPWLFIPFAFIPRIPLGAIFGISWVTFALSALFNLLGSSIFLEKSGFVLLKNERWADNSGYTAQEYLGERDSSLESLGRWGENQLAPEWTYDFRNWTKSERDSMKRSTLIDLDLGIMADCYIRECEDKPPNALVPLAVHGCGITCLIMHHHDDRTKAAVKLGIVNLAPYILNKGMVLAALEVGAVEEKPRPVSFREFWKNM